MDASEWYTAISFERTAANIARIWTALCRFSVEVPRGVQCVILSHQFIPIRAFGPTATSANIVWWWRQRIKMAAIHQIR